MSSGEIERIRRAYDRYAVEGRWDDSNPGRQRMLEERNAALERLLRKAWSGPIESCRILEVGCGQGDVLGWLMSRGIPAQNMAGVDLLPDRIEAARASYPLIRFSAADATNLPFADASFDVVLLFTVFSSVLDSSIANRMASEVDRVLSQNGFVLWYDMRYPNPYNTDVRSFSAGAINRLFPNRRVELETITLLPPLAYRLGRRTVAAYDILMLFPFLRSHLVGVLYPASS